MDNSMFGILPCTAASKVYALQPITEPALSITLFHLWCCSPSRLPQQTSKIFSTSYCTSIPASSGKKACSSPSDILSIGLPVQYVFSVWVPGYLHFCLMLRIQKSGVAILFLPCEITTISLAFVTFSNRFTDLLICFLPPVHHLYIQWMHRPQTTSACGLDPALLEVWGIQEMVDVSALITCFFLSGQSKFFHPRGSVSLTWGPSRVISGLQFFRSIRFYLYGTKSQQSPRSAL